MLTTSTVDKWLASGYQASSVVGVYRRSCNLINHACKFLTLATTEIGPGPFTMVIELLNSGCLDFRDYLDVNDEISIGQNYLAAGRLVINTQQPVLWESMINWEKFANFTDYSWLPFLRQQLINNAPKPSFALLLEANNSDPFIIQARKGLDILEQGLKRHFLADILRGVELLAGLGLGLTPAGDDFLLGVIFAVWMNLPTTIAKQWCPQIHQVAAARTTRLSGYWLEVAANGHASKPWHDLLNDIYDLNEKRMWESAQGLGDYGYSSGYDALAGFVMASSRLKIPSPEVD